MKPMLSIIIPCLDEEDNIVNTLQALQGLRQRGHEVILCDGGSTDNTLKLSTNLVDITLTSDAGRAKQMNAAAQHANGDWLCFLHADTTPPTTLDEAILAAINNCEKVWGRFDIKLNNNFFIYRIIERLINFRSRISGIASGDQGIFISTKTFNQLHGFANIPLMEDIEISKRLRKLSPPICINSQRLITSSRRWEKHGIVKTVLLMWQLRLRYFLGTSPDALLKAYQPHTDEK